MKFVHVLILCNPFKGGINFITCTCYRYHLASLRDYFVVVVVAVARQAVVVVVVADAYLRYSNMEKHLYNVFTIEKKSN